MQNFIKVMSPSVRGWLAGVAAHGVVLLDLRTVMDGHVPAGEIDHLRAGGKMGVMERRA